MVAVGDSENDVEMIRLAALGIAMGNATDGAKAAADAVTDTLENDGLYKAFEMAGMLWLSNSSTIRDGRDELLCDL